MDVLFNDYLDGSIKNVERENTEGKVQEASFIAFNENNRSNNRKNSCTAQLTEQAVTKEWSKENYAEKLSGKTLVFTCG